MDIIIATTIFLAGIIMFYIYALNYEKDATVALDSLRYDGEKISDGLLTPGYPVNWTKENVLSIGITTNDKINETKLALFYDLSSNEYARTKAIFNTQYNYYLDFSEPITLNEQIIEYIGQKSGSPKNIIKIKRITIYENKPVLMQIYIWN